jgi:hypothetical protein
MRLRVSEILTLDGVMETPDQWFFNSRIESWIRMC